MRSAIGVLALRAAILLLMPLACCPRASALTYTAHFLDSTGFATTQGYAASGTGAVGKGALLNVSREHAVFWSAPSASVVDLHPSGFDGSEARGVSGATQVGSGYVEDSYSHALMWSGAANTVVDLNPAGFTSSYAYGAGGAYQVGSGYGPATGQSTHALMWNGTATSAVDLNPLNFTHSEAVAVSGSAQVGNGQFFFIPRPHALLWHGTAASYVDLHPPDFDYSYATSVSGNYQAGYAFDSGYGEKVHALLWTGTAASAVDLNTVTFDSCAVQAISGTTQVGSGSGPSTGTGFGGFPNYHALVWHSTAASVVDLHQFLTPLGSSFYVSFALGISENGSIIGYANDNFGTYAILWTPDSGVAGDYNNDGIVDAADYVYWRKGTSQLHNEVATIGSNTPEDYKAWRARFGNPPGSGAAAVTASSGSVPEPAAFAYLTLAESAFMFCIRRRP